MSLASATLGSAGVLVKMFRFVSIIRLEPALIAMLPEPSRLVLLIVLMFVPLTRVSCLPEMSTGGFTLSRFPVIGLNEKLILRPHYRG